MKSKLLLAVIAALALNGCERKNAAIQSELRLIEKTAKDSKQPDYIRESAGIFASVLSEEKEVPDDKLKLAHGNMVGARNATSIATYVAFLKAIEKKLPDTLPPLEAYVAMKAKAGGTTLIEYNVGQTAIMMSNSIENISLYGDPNADAEVAGVLKRLEEKHGRSETGKKILALLNMVHEQGLTARSWGIKPWESPRGGGGNID